MKAKPRGNLLARFVPVLERIQRRGGGDSPLLAGATQAQFIQASPGEWSTGAVMWRIESWSRAGKML